MNVAKNNKKIIVSVVMALMVVMAMMPGMAFASTQAAANENGVVAAVADTVTITSAPSTIAAGQQAQLAATYTSDVSVVHVEWVSSSTTVASVSKNKGVLNALTAGTTTITAKLITGEAGSTGGSVLATATATVTVTPAVEYGFQGIGGNQLKMTTPSDIAAGVQTAAGYLNTINAPVSADAEGNYSFSFTMSAGMNQFNEALFKAQNMPLIKVYDFTGGVKGNVVAFGNSAGTIDDGIAYVGVGNKIITVSVNGLNLTPGDRYLLEFGSNVCGNNTSKTLGVPVQFNFVAE